MTTYRKPKKRAAPKKKSAAKKEKLYTRYDPETGQKVRVTKDTFEYEDWPSRKPSKKKIKRAAFKSDPLGTTGTVVQEAVKKGLERQAERTGTRIYRTAAGGLAGSAAIGSARTAAAAIAPAAAAAAIVGAALYAMGKIGQLRNVAAGERANRISREFVAAQQATIKRLRVHDWNDVPQEIRTQLVNGYKKNITAVYSTTVPLAGTIRPSQAIPYGR